MTDDFKPSARVILDSISPSGHRLTTLEVTIHRYMLPEFNTHRVFSRNSASSRAIKFMRMVAKVLTSKVYPTAWRLEKPGMQGGDIITDPEIVAKARASWDRARDAAVAEAKYLNEELGIHKSIANRLLEPFAPHTIIVTASSFEGFFNQRCNPQAQDDIRVAAEAMWDAYNDSVPRFLNYGQWHTPYITKDDWTEAYSRGLTVEQQTHLFKQISAARSARVSYLTHDGVRNWEKDLELFNRLVSAKPGHWSPLEHVATPINPLNIQAVRGNFTGWAQLRHFYELAA